jgi:hypothetical protein
MAIWDEGKHKRFHGKFASTGLNVQTLKERHGVEIDHGMGLTSGVRHKGKAIGTVKQHQNGYHAHVYIPRNHPADTGVTKVSDKPFRTKAEAAAAIAAAHPSVKTINHEPLGDKRKKGYR